jgi:hypothetical protein
MVPVGQEALQDRLRPFPPAARPRRAPPLGPVRSPLHKWKAQSQPRYFSRSCAHLCSDAPLFIHIRQVPNEIERGYAVVIAGDTPVMRRGSGPACLEASSVVSRMRGRAIIAQRKTPPRIPPQAGFPAPTLSAGERFGAAEATHPAATCSANLHCRPNSDTGVCEIRARPTPPTSPRPGPKTGGAFSWTSLPPPTLRAVLTAVGYNLRLILALLSTLLCLILTALTQAFTTRSVLKSAC